MILILKLLILFTFLALIHNFYFFKRNIENAKTTQRRGKDIARREGRVKEFEVLAAGFRSGEVPVSFPNTLLCGGCNQPFSYHRLQTNGSHASLCCHPSSVRHCSQVEVDLLHELGSLRKLAQSVGSYLLRMRRGLEAEALHGVKAAYRKWNEEPQVCLDFQDDERIPLLGTTVIVQDPSDWEWNLRKCKVSWIQATVATVSNVLCTVTDPEDGMQKSYSPSELLLVPNEGNNHAE